MAGERVLGVDLGCANASVAWMQDGQAVLAADDSGRVLQSSMVAYPEDGGPLTGNDARKWRLTDPSRAVAGIRRLLGRDVADPVVAHVAARASFRVAEGPTGRACVVLGDQLHATAEVAAEAMRSLRARAEAAGAGTTRKCVLVVPAHAGDSARLGYRLAAQMAGMEVVRLVNAPAACAVVHLQANAASPARRVMVFSLGAGGFDAAVVDMRPRTVAVRASAGDALLGADTLDGALVERLRARFQDVHGVDLGGDPVAMQRLWGAAENAKIHLGDNPSVEVRLREMSYGPDGPLDLEDELERQDLDGPVQDLVARCMAVCQQALERGGVRAESLQGVLLCGGLSRLPAVAEAVSRQLGAPILTDAQHDGAAAEGAALLGDMLVNRARPGEATGLTLLDIHGHAVSLEAGGARQPLLDKGCPVPFHAVRTLTTEADNQTSLAVKLVETGTAGSGHDAAVGELAVEGLPARRAGEVQVDVTVEVDADGVLTASAVSRADGSRSGPPVRLGVEVLEQELVALRMRRGEVRV